MKKRLFIIKNGTHYINAKNYIGNKGPAENYIFLTIRKFKGYKDFCNEIAQDPDFKLLGILYLDHTFPGWNYFSAISSILKVKRIASKIKFVDEVIFTNYLSWTQQFIINQFRSYKTVLLSDGTRVLLVAESRKKDKSVQLKSVPFGGGKFVIENLLGIVPIKNLHFYSPAKLELAEGDTLELYQYNSSTSSIVDQNKFFFIGSPLVEIKYLTLERHLYYLKKIKDQFINSEIYYFAHRRETEENLAHYEFFGQIVKNELPFEERMESEEKLPGVISTFISSVVMNLPAAYPQVQFYYYPLASIDLIAGSKFEMDYNLLLESFRKIKEPNFSKFPR